MRLLVCGDLHLKPAASDYDLDGLAIPTDVDAVLILGDLTHRAGPDDEALARRFLDRIDRSVPIIYVPGNHDRAPMQNHVTEPHSSAHSGHLAAHDIDGVTVVGWGCEQRSLSPAIDQAAFNALNPATAPRGQRRYVADRTAERLEAACHAVVCGEATVSDAADELEIHQSERPAFHRGIETIEEAYDTIAGLLEGHEDVLLATHLPPFNVPFDRHHSMGTREDDKEGLHMGSIALKLAIREHDVFAAFSGHSHHFGYDTGESPDGRPHVLNLGYRGIGTVSLDPTAGVFTFTRN